MLDMNTLEAGQDFADLSENYIIFITRKDELGYGLPVYHIGRDILEVNKRFGDGAHIIYVNASEQDDTELGRLMHDFHCKDAKDMYSDILARRVYELKETQEGMDSMREEMDKIYQEGIAIGERRGEQRGLRIGEQKAKKETARCLAKMGTPADVIMQVLHVDEDVLNQWFRS